MKDYLTKEIEEYMKATNPDYETPSENSVSIWKYLALPFIVVIIVCAIILMSIINHKNKTPAIVTTNEVPTELLQGSDTETIEYTDTIHYKNLVPGKSYTIQVRHCKDNKDGTTESILIDKVNFTPKTENGTMDIKVKIPK